MRRKNNDKKEEGLGKSREKKHSWRDDLAPETKRRIAAIFAFIGAIIFVLSYIGKGGNAGGYIFRALAFLLGGGYFFAPLSLILIGFSLLTSEGRRFVGVAFLGGFLFFLSSLSLFEIAFGNGRGGFLGGFIGSPILALFDFWASLVIMLGLLLVAFLLMFRFPWGKRMAAEAPPAPSEEINPALVYNDGVKRDAEETLTSSGIKAMLENISATIQAALQNRHNVEPHPDPFPPPPSSSTVVVGDTVWAEAPRNEPLLSIRKIEKKFSYKKPPFELLQSDRGKPSSGDIKANVNVIQRTLENFGIVVEMGEVSVGPTVTQYTLRPAEGVKLARITALHNDLSLALAAHPIRIEAPIPGRSLVGVEVPNRATALVGARSLLEHRIFHESTNPLLFTLGRDVTGNPVFADLGRMPHLLISGATGSGKSVCIHSIVTSFLYRNPPEVLRFIIVDPKRVELTVYNDIPHLLTPVITDPKRTIQALRWATKEMDRRYELLSSHHARDIASFNTKISKPGNTTSTAPLKAGPSTNVVGVGIPGKGGGDEDLLPYVVIIIDELADLMAIFPREVEASIIRLAQMARAVGIHLIVATQRPSVEVITGLIKANITSRIAFQVASLIDSRTILDMAGAEKLLGNGDMLFLAGDTAKPRRIQGAYVSEQEVKRVVDFLREESEVPVYEESIWETPVEEEAREGGDDFLAGEDPLYEDAERIVVEAQKASASYLQRRMRIGYARAARFLDVMEERGIVGPADGAKAREVLMKEIADSGHES